MAQEMEREDRDRLITIGEQVTRMTTDLAEMKGELRAVSGMATTVALQGSEIATLKEALKSVKEDLEAHQQDVKSRYVLKTDFDPIRNMYYAVISLIVMSVVGALIALVLRQ